ncbi:zinc ABC transporter substrate-binding protein [Rhizomicrobium electricum]|uniref:High-affinity zinc uptake system protein ZnuA n=1 Tax=Rhizomicrobium electricum TaxID=480070 RepID=A0ABP3Q491_9PROT|nr:zinc ABC transporter substrate-binding protein [Rhizomicrobium electricum]NIJ50531.1 zinc transport system substrate-binding protein [Rhizomicrobium electricum]
MQIVKFLLRVSLVAVTAAAAAAEPKVLATLKPVHSLVAGVMEGAGQPDLLIGGALSEHSYALKPSDARKVREATLIFEVGPDMETYLSGALAAAGGRVVVLEQAPGVKRVTAREGGLWGDDHDHGHDHGGTDPHVWLDPQNAIAFTKAIAEALVRTDPAHAGLYRANAARRIAMLQGLDRELAATLSPVKDRPYLVFHDAYHYFEARYDLKPAGAVTVAPDRPVGARRIADLRQTVTSGRAVCLFREPQFPPKLIDTLDQDTKARIGVLDPLGADLQPGPDLYPRLMRNLAQSLRSCLSKNR